MKSTTTVKQSYRLSFCDEWLNKNFFCHRQLQHNVIFSLKFGLKKQTTAQWLTTTKTSSNSGFNCYKAFNVNVKISSFLMFCLQKDRNTIGL